MGNKIYDPNFLQTDQVAEDTVAWYEISFDAFDLYGLICDGDDILARRMPNQIAETVSRGVRGQNGYCAGGRIRFSTDSEFVALKVEYAKGAVPTVCNHCITYGFDLYQLDQDKKTEAFVAAFRPANGFDCQSAEFKVNTRNHGKNTDYTLNMPHFAEVKTLSLGIEKGKRLGRGARYRNDTPVIFYGSSITHGAAAGRPGNTYENFISQKYNLHYRNLGYAGNAKGEPIMADYIADCDMIAFVCDYDHNAPSIEHLADTHYPFYQTIRRKHPEIPYVMLSRPDFFRDPIDHAKRREVILQSYNRAIASGDKNVYFLDGETLFQGDCYESCTSDGCHPNDLGFYRMANRIGAVLAQALGID